MSLDDLMLKLSHLPGKHSQSSHAGGRSVGIESIRNQLDYPYLPDNDKIEATIAKLSEMKTLSKNKVMDAADKLGVSVGFADHVASVIKSDRKSKEGTVTRSPEEARIDRILRIRDSSGKARARKLR